MNERWANDVFFSSLPSPFVFIVIVVCRVPCSQLLCHAVPSCAVWCSRASCCYAVCAVPCRLCRLAGPHMEIPTAPCRHRRHHGKQQWAAAGGCWSWRGWPEEDDVTTMSTTQQCDGCGQQSLEPVGVDDGECWGQRLGTLEVADGSW